MTSPGPRSRRGWLAAAVVALLSLLATWARRSRLQPPLPEAAVRESRTVTSYDGAPLHVERDGPDDADLTVLFVHGLLARSAEFDEQWNHLRTSARMVRFDHRGHGRSGRTRGAVSIDQLGRDVESVLEQCVPAGPVVLIAHSMGGMAVMSMASRRPDLFGSRIVGAALLATAAGHDLADRPVETAFRRLARLHALTPLLGVLRLTAPVSERLRPRGTRGMRWVVRQLLFGRDDAAPDVVRQAQRMLEEPPLRTLTALQGTVLRNDQRAALAALRRIPVGVVVGADDRLTRAGHSRALARDLGAMAELVVLPGVGHALPQSAPADTNAAVDRLLARVRGYALTNPSGSQTSPAVVT